MDASVLIPTRGRRAKVCACVAGLARQTMNSGRFEVLVGFDGKAATDRAACEAAWRETGGRAGGLRAFEFPNEGYAIARNRLLAEARGDILISINDDVRPCAEFVETHVREQHAAKERGGVGGRGAIVVGHSPFVVPEGAGDTLVNRLVRETSWVFFYDVMNTAAGLADRERDWGFRHCFGLNFSCSVEAARAVGGFTGLPHAYGYDDIELAFRLRERLGMRVLYRPEALAEHDHAYTPAGLLERERALGHAAWHFARVNPEFGRAVFGCDIASREEIERVRGLVEQERQAAMGLRESFEALGSMPAGAAMGPEAEELICRMYQRYRPLKQWMWRLGVMEATPCTESRSSAPSRVRERRPTVAIAIPMHNAGATIEATIESVRSQSDINWRCVVVDDGSTDGSFDAVCRMMAGDERIEMIRQANKGLPGARNTGLERALEVGAEFVMLLDADDVLMPGGLSALVEAAAETGAAYGGFEFLGPDGVSIGRQSPITAPYVGLDEQLDWNRTMLQVSVFSCEAIGETRFDPEVPLAEDWLWCARLALRGVRTKAVERIVSGYRLRPASMSKDFARMARFHQGAIRTIFGEARAAGWDDRVDLGDARLERAAGASALAYATMDALVDRSADKERAVRLLGGSIRPARFTVDQWVQAAATAVPFGLCIAPELGHESERCGHWLTSLRDWWRASVNEQWMEEEDLERALHVLARKVIHPDRIADAMLDDATARRDDSAVGVLGLDRTGRRLARGARARGRTVLVFDDWSEDGEAALLERCAGVEVARDAGSLERVAAACLPRTWLVGTQGAPAERALMRIRDAQRDTPARIVRWAEHRERLGARNDELVRRALAEAERPILAGSGA